MCGMHACMQVHRWIQVCEYMCSGVCVCVCTYTEAQDCYWLYGSMVVLWLFVLFPEAGSLGWIQSLLLWKF